MDKGIGGLLGVGGLLATALILRSISGSPPPQQAIAQPDAVGGDETISCDLADARYGFRNIYAARVKRRADHLAKTFNPEQLNQLREGKYQTLLVVETLHGAYDGQSGKDREQLPESHQWLNNHTMGLEQFPRQSVENDLIFDITAIGYALDGGDFNEPNVSVLSWVGGRCGNE